MMPNQPAPDAQAPRQLRDPLDDPNLPVSVRAAFAARKDFYGVAGDQGIKRRQAGAAYPLLATLIPGRPMLRIAIDMDKPLQSAIQAMFGLSKGAVKRLAGLDLPVPAIEDPTKDAIFRGDLAHLMEAVPPEWTPKSPQDMEAFLDVIFAVGKHMANAAELDAATLLKPCGGKWAQFRGTLWKAANPPRRDGDVTIPTPDYDGERFMAQAREVRDMVVDFVTGSLLPAVANATGDRDVFLTEAQRQAIMAEAAQILLATKSATGVLDASHRWHRAHLDIITEDEPAAAPAAPANEFERQGVDPRRLWAKLIDDQVAPNGLHLVALNDADQLEQESRRMNHCVRGYHSSCAFRGHHIISVRQADGTSIATVELSKTDGRTIQLIQERGPSNAAMREREHRAWGAAQAIAPELQAAAAAVDWLVGQVAVGAVRLRMDEVARHKEAIRKVQGRDAEVHQAAQRQQREADNIAHGCGFDWRQRGAADRALARWQPWMPAGTVASVEGIVGTRPALLEIVRAINPYAPIVEAAQRVARVDEPDGGEPEAPRFGM